MATQGQRAVFQQANFTALNTQTTRSNLRAIGEKASRLIGMSAVLLGFVGLLRDKHDDTTMQ